VSTTPQVDDLLKLAGAIEGAGLVAARQTASDQPWYHAARPDMAHAANCFAVASAIRAIANNTNGEQQS
jgi:hypothetical protein